MGASYSYDVDAEGSTGTEFFELRTAPTGMTIDSGTGVITWLPSAATVGQPVTIRMIDGAGNAAFQSYTLTVRAAVPPLITSSPVTTVTAETTYRYAVTATDSGDRLSFSVVGPAGMTIDPITGLILWHPAIADTGNHVVTVHATDVLGVVAEQTYTLAVTADTEAPGNPRPKRNRLAGSSSSKTEPPLTPPVNWYTYPVTSGKEVKDGYRGRLWTGSYRASRRHGHQ